MMYTLIVTRHAKSAWDDPSQDDFDRPLNGRGRKSAPAIAEWLVAQGYLPDVVLVSGARRTVETWERMTPIMPSTAAMESAPALYLASPDTVLNVIKSQTAPCVMVIGHNPGLADFAKLFAKTPPAHSKFTQYPTAATTVFRLQIDGWNSAAWGQGEVAEFIVPRDLVS